MDVDGAARATPLASARIDSGSALPAASAYASAPDRAQGPAQAARIPASERLPLPDTIIKGRIIWPTVITVAAVHVLALAAFIPWLFDWTSMIAMLVLWQLGGLGISLGYHRVLAHKSAKLPKWLEHAFVVVALCDLQGTPGHWVATHRFHHSHADEQPDPHSPLVTFLWAHMGWFCVYNAGTYNIATYAKYAPDILADPFYMRLEKSQGWYLYYVISCVLFFAFGFAAGAIYGGVMAGLQSGLSLLVWAGFVRTVLHWHMTWAVNSVTHLFGYTNYETDDHSRNNWFVGLVGVGEGWHNNHHADPASASNQHRWWEIDTTWYAILLLKALGLATDVVEPRHVRKARGARAA